MIYHLGLILFNIIVYKKLIYLTNLIKKKISTHNRSLRTPSKTYVIPRVKSSLYSKPLAVVSAHFLNSLPFDNSVVTELIKVNSENKGKLISIYNLFDVILFFSS